MDENNIFVQGISLFTFMYVFILMHINGKITKYGYK